MRSTPVAGTSNIMGRRELNPGGTLPAISEDGTTFMGREPPPVPPRAWNRPHHMRFGLGAPPRHNFEGSPPAYSHFDPSGVEGPKGEKLADVRKGLINNKHIAKRGGWKRLSILALISILLIVGLVVGLVVGLRNKHNSSSS